jgi:hypothetical protein
VPGFAASRSLSGSGIGDSAMNGPLNNNMALGIILIGLVTCFLIVAALFVDGFGR